MSELTSKDRLIEFAEYKEISMHAFEVMCGLANGYMKNKTTKPSTPILEKVHGVFPELSMNWLLFGEGDMLVLPSAGVQTSSADNSEVERLEALLKERTEALALVQSKYIALLEKMSEIETSTSRTA